MSGPSIGPCLPSPTLTVDECERLLRRGTFGRVVLSTPHGNEIVPVNYAVHESTVVVHTSPDGLLARHADGAELLFEVDLVDEERWNGWSVVARGRGRISHDFRAVPPVRPWAAGERSCELQLRWDVLTGRTGRCRLGRRGSDVLAKASPMTPPSQPLGSADVLLADGSIAVVRPLRPERRTGAPRAARRRL